MTPTEIAKSRNEDAMRLAVGEMQRPGFIDTPAAVSASMLDCVDALDRLQVMLGKRGGAAPPHVSGVPVSSSPRLNPFRAAAAKD